MDVLTIGAATRDIFLQTAALHVGASLESATGVVGCVAMGSKVTVEKMVLASGGGATNAAVTCAHWGLSTEALVRLGDDEPGHAILQELHQAGVQTGRVRRVRGGQSGYSTLLLAENGERTALVFRGVSGEWSRDDLPTALGATMLYLTSLGGNLEVWHTLLTMAKREGVRVFANPGQAELSAPVAFRTLLPSIDCLLLNLEEGRQLAQLPQSDALSVARALGAATPLVLITDGPRGAYGLSHTEGAWYAASTGAPSLSRTGAGDAFGSGVAVALQRGAPIAEALAAGTLNAEAVIQHIGAKHGILPIYPSAQDIARITVKKIS
jgi:ribokinase